MQSYITGLRENESEVSTAAVTNSLNSSISPGGVITNLVPCDQGCGGAPGSGGSRKPVQTWGPLIGTRWGQGCGYNDFTPKSGDDCGRGPAGCGPVAVAQVMWYHRNRFGSMTYNGVPINFNNMARSPNPNRAGNTPDIARLMRFIGDWIIIKWASDYAMALPSKIPDFLENVGFSSSKRDWSHGTVVSEIKNDRPVIVKAVNPKFIISDDQHIWVIEGYRYDPNNRAEHYFFNWGWNGGGNGWYGIYDWKPTWRDDKDEYSQGRKMITVR